MGQAGSQPTPSAASALPRARRAHTLPHEPLRHAPKVLPSLTESPRLRSTDNGAILHSGGTISGRRPGSLEHPPHGHVHPNAHRSRSAGAGDPGDPRMRSRDPMHRSHTNLDLRFNEGDSISKRFGSEPDLRLEEVQQKPKCTNKHFRKKYRAPPPPTSNIREGSSPDSSEGNARSEPQRKLRLFKTRNETKKINGHAEVKQPTYRSFEYKSLDMTDSTSFERRYKSPCKDKEQHFKYPDNQDMIQSTASLKREEHLLQTKLDYRKTRTDRVSGCRAKTTKSNEHSEAWKTPLLNRNFRHSERFKTEESAIPVLRREKTFDGTLASDKGSDSSRSIHEAKIKAIDDELKACRISPLETNKHLRKSLPSLLVKSSDEKDEFQAELKKATNRIRHELGNKIIISHNKTSHNNKPSAQTPNPSKTVTQSKVKDSSLKYNDVKSKIDTNLGNTRRPMSRSNDAKSKPSPKNISKENVKVNKDKFNSKESNKSLPERGQASGKESTPEHSPIRRKETPLNLKNEKHAKSAPSKQFYFGMIESKQSEAKDHLKDFPGLGSPIIQEISNFHLIEQKLLGYHEEDADFDRFNARLKEDCKIKNISSESALSSSGSDGEGSDGSLGIALRLRPTMPKKQPVMPRFSPAQAWRQLATLDAHLSLETRPLAVETKVSADITPESSPRSEQSADKSGDSGISGDHAHSDLRIDSPSRHHPAELCTGEDGTPTWTPQQDLGDSSSDSAQTPGVTGATLTSRLNSTHTYSPGVQPFSLSLPRDPDKGKQLQHGFNSLQKLKKSVSGAFGAALGSRRFDIEHEPMLEEPEQNWFLTKSAPNSLSNPLLFQQPSRVKELDEDIKEEPYLPPPEKEEDEACRRGKPSYLSWGGHVMYLPPAAPHISRQPLSMLGPIDRPVRSKSSGSLEVAAAKARAALAAEMRERERSASPAPLRALPATVTTLSTQRHSTSSSKSRSKRFTFQSTVRQLERRKLAEKLSKEADLKEQQRRTELEAMRRVEEEFQRKRAREKANIRQQLRLVTSGATSMPTPSNNHQNKTRESSEGWWGESHVVGDRGSDLEQRPRRSNPSSEISAVTPVRSIELSEWREGGATGEARVYRDWARAAALAHTHAPTCARMPIASQPAYNGGAGAAETSAFSGSPRSDNYRMEFARGRSPRTPRTPRAPRLLLAPGSPSTTSGSDLSVSARRPINVSVSKEPTIEEPEEESEEPVIVPTLLPSVPAHARSALLSH